MDYAKLSVKLLLIALLVVGVNLPLYGDVLDFSSPDFVLLTALHTDGSLVVDPSWTWNGAPLSDTNHPSEANLRLQSDINLYSSLSDPALMFVQVTNISTTQGAFWFGSAIPATVQTGIRLTGIPLGLNTPLFGDQYANSGQALMCCGPSELTTTLMNTPGYVLATSGDGLLIHTMTGTDYGFSSLSASLRQEDIQPRIFGGGVFSLNFGSGMNLSTQDWSLVQAGAEYGGGRQFVPLSLTAKSYSARSSTGTSTSTRIDNSRNARNWHHGNHSTGSHHAHQFSSARSA